jgi:hypothetical protein
MKEDYMIKEESADLTWNWGSIHNRERREATEREGNKGRGQRVIPLLTWSLITTM